MILINMCLFKVNIQSEYIKHGVYYNSIYFNSAVNIWGSMKCDCHSVEYILGVIILDIFY